MYDENIIHMAGYTTAAELAAACLQRLNAEFAGSEIVDDDLFFDSSHLFGIRAVSVTSRAVDFYVISNGFCSAMITNFQFNAAYIYELRWRKSKNQTSFYISFWSASATSAFSNALTIIFAAQLNGERSAMFTYSMTSARSWFHGSSIVIETSGGNICPPTSNYPVLVKEVNPYDGSEFVDLYTFKYYPVKVGTGVLLQSGNEVYAVIGGTNITSFALRLA